MQNKYDQSLFCVTYIVTNFTVTFGKGFDVFLLTVNK